MRKLDLGCGRAAMRWFNRNDHVTYENPEGHTFSLYLRGGTGTFRLDGTHMSGWPGACCLMPHGQSSTWEITSPFEFVHLYLPDREARRLFAETFDRDARLMSLPELTFADRPELAASLRLLAKAAEAGDPLLGEEAMAEIVRRAFADSRPVGTLKGGLAPHARRRVTEFIEAGLGGSLRLRELAEIAHLSEFHFQRSFAASLGVSPSAWIAHRRIERARTLLRAGEPIAGVAVACGYSSQSHLTRAFRDATGRTPAAYRALIDGARRMEEPVSSV
ncbi:AraC family transcriptional regulator [Labrys miyagiensis]|uniref:AraC family transcriptional regulator n=2 Tax=Labrys miyagiensis TaxID=346912 RepID=A0ABQ6CBE0_9HYPH|nr:AraC family transcriptional regulator [Labrys miyagiensis]